MTDFPHAPETENEFETPEAVDLAPARLRMRWLPARTLLWMAPAAAALAASVVLLPEPTGDRTNETRPAIAEAPARASAMNEAPVVAEAPMETPATRDAPAMAAAPDDDGPATTGSFGPVPSRSLAARREGARSSPALAPAPTVAPAAPGHERASAPPPSPNAAIAAPDATSTLQVPVRTAALPPAAMTRTEEPPSAPSQPAPQARDASQPQLDLPPDEIAAHLARGEERLKAGDLAAARLYFERAALAGDARGALGMARTYDPEVLDALPVLGPQGDAVAAKAWYERAESQRAGG